MIEKKSFASHLDGYIQKTDWLTKDRVYRHMFAQPKAARHINASGDTESAWSLYLSLRIQCKGQVLDLTKYVFEVAKKEAAEANAFELKKPYGFPYNRFRFLEAKVWIDAFSNNALLNKSDVLQLAKDQLTVAPTYTIRQWDAAPQSEYQTAIDLLLLVDARDEAQNMIDNARGMRGKHVKELFANAKLILKSKGPVRQNLAAMQQYRTTFDAIRDPSYDGSKVGHPGGFHNDLVMACMWQKFFEPGEIDGSGSYNIDRAIDLIWE
jgi:hypothetical protein